MNLLQRRRAILAGCAEPPPPPNGLVPGSYTRGSSVWSVDTAGNLLISAFYGGSSSQIIIPFVRPLSLAVGDTLRLVIKKVSGSVSGPVFTDCWIGGNKIISNKAWGTETNVFDETMTAASREPARILFSNRTGEKSYSSYKASVKIYINGTQVIPEV